MRTHSDGYTSDPYESFFSYNAITIPDQISEPLLSGCIRTVITHLGNVRMREAIVIVDHLLHSPDNEKEFYLLHQDPAWTRYTEFNIKGLTTRFGYTEEDTHDQSEEYNLITYSPHADYEVHQTHDSLQSGIQ